MTKRLFIVLLIFSLPLISLAQSGKKTPKKKSNSNFLGKTKPAKYIIGGVGACNFLGELGGANQVGTHFVKDFEFSMTRPSAALGYRYKLNRFFALSGGLYYCLVSGSDATTKEPSRQNRNLSFRSNIFELSGQGEFYFLKENKTHLFRVRNAKAKKVFRIQPYLFGGVGVFHFNPQAKYDGKWVNLRPLSTEGEGMPNGPKEYSRFSMCIPYGIGASEGIGKDWTIGIEIGMRYTFTDYIDDVSGVYYDNAAIKKEKGDMAAYLADPSLHRMPPEYGGDSSGGWQAAPGQVRGHSNHNDAYMFTNITISYKIKNSKKIKSKF